MGLLSKTGYQGWLLASGSTNGSRTLLCLCLALTGQNATTIDSKVTSKGIEFLAFFCMVIETAWEITKYIIHPSMKTLSLYKFDKHLQVSNDISML